MNPGVSARLFLAAALAAAAGQVFAAGQGTQADAARRKVEKGVAGKLWANGDDEFVLYVNDKRTASHAYTDDPESKQVTLKPGDLLIVRVMSKDPVRGFALLFQSNSRRAEFSSSTGDWYSFQPKDPKKWWDVGDFSKLPKTPATATDHQEVRGNIERLANTGCSETLWGDPSQSTVYLIKIVTHEDLME